MYQAGAGGVHVPAVPGNQEPLLPPRGQGHHTQPQQSHPVQKGFFHSISIFFSSVADQDPGSVPFRPLDQGSGMGKKSGSGWIRIRDEQPGSYFLELRNHFFGFKYLNS